MHVPAGHRFPDATGVVFALTAWAPIAACSYIYYWWNNYMHCLKLDIY